MVEGECVSRNFRVEGKARVLGKSVAQLCSPTRIRTLNQAKEEGQLALIRALK
jgi:hypothetical protein